jgi:MFS family permease
MNASVWRLVIAQALAGANATVVYATGALVGETLAPSKLLATLPVSLFVAGMAAATLPAGALARRFGRRLVFLLGALCGLLLGLLGAWSIVQSSWVLFCLAMPFGGAYAAVVLTFRFAAAESVAVEHRATALSLVMAGGVAGGLLGPQIVVHTMMALPSHAFAATYIASAMVAVLSAAILAGVAVPAPEPRQPGPARRVESTSSTRPDTRTVMAVLCGAVSYTIMNFLMTSAPLAMEHCGLSLVSASLGIQWHVVAMYAPGFVTGMLIARFSAARVVLAGFVVTGTALIVGVSGLAVGYFWTSLVLLGIGWNFSFVGASAMLVESQTSTDKVRMQAINDFVVLGCVMAGSLLSGGVLARYGWQLICLLALVPVATAALSLVAMSRVPRRTLSIGG